MKIVGALYLRVSTVDQATKNNSPEGFSIPAQRELCRGKGKELNVTNYYEYADRGESARSTDRPGLQRLLADLKKNKGIKYVIVHKLDRLARNLHDHVMIELAIKKAGAQLISVTESIDETPSGRLVQGIMATIAEFYSRNLAAEALKGAIQKAKQGGTPGCAPLGYINVTERINRREMHIVKPDPERASLIRWGLERFATGDYSEVRLHAELYKRGLRSIRKSKGAMAAISRSCLNRLLRNRYYAGFVTYCGVEYKGNHQPLITPAVFAAIQAVRQARKGYSHKGWKHHHYLSRLLVCAQCGRQLCLTISKGRYPYYFCINRQARGCRLPYIPVSLIEKEIDQILANLKFSTADQKKINQEITHELTNDKHYTLKEIKTQTQRCNRLQMEQENLLHAHYDKLIPDSLLASEQKRLTLELKQAQELLKEGEERLAVITQRQEQALNLLTPSNLERMYHNANPIIRRLLCQALFTSIVFDDSVTTRRATWGIARDHHVIVVKIHWHNPVNIPKLAAALLAISMERDTNLPDEAKTGKKYAKSDTIEKES